MLRLKPSICVLALVSLVTAAVPSGRIAALLPADGLLGTLAGVAAGGLLAGNPVTSYVLAGEFMAAGVSLTIATAFIVSWVTLGILHIAAEGRFSGSVSRYGVPPCASPLRSSSRSSSGW